MSVPEVAVEVCLRLPGDECGECPGDSQLLAQQAGGCHGEVDRIPVPACSLYSGHADPVAGGRAGEDVEVAVGRDAGAGDQYCLGLYEEGGPPCLSVLS